MNKARVFAQIRALLESVFKGLSEVKPMNYHRLGNFGEQVHSVHCRQVYRIKCDSICYPKAIGNLVSKSYRKT